MNTMLNIRLTDNSGQIDSINSVCTGLYAHITTFLQTVQGFEYMMNYAVKKNYRTISLFHNYNDFVYPVNNQGIEQHFDTMTLWLVDALFGIRNIPSMYYAPDDMVDYADIVVYTKIDYSYEINENNSIPYELKQVLDRLNIKQYKIRLTRFYGREKINGKNDGYYLQINI